MEFDEQTKREVRRQTRKVVIIGGPGIHLHKAIDAIRNITKQYQPAEPFYFGCGKCGHSISEGAANAHLAKCYPDGVPCGKCRKIITEYDFVAHYKSCTR